MYVRKREPAFIPKLIQRRLRLRNCFSEEFPEITNIYVRRHQHQCMQGNSLRAASRQLRFETDLLIDEEIKSGKIDIPFVLDVMIVKEIGVFPTWISFPYKPQHLDKLTINLRIVQPGTSLVPTEWIEVARYGEQYRSWFKSPLAWNIIMVIAFYALGQFSMKPDPAQPLIQHINQPTTMEGTISTKQPAAGGKGNAKSSFKPNSKKSLSRKEAVIVNHKSVVADAYLLATASYVVDKLVIDCKEREYDVNGKLVPLGVDDPPKESRFYKEGYVQFGREVLDAELYWTDGFGEVEEKKSMIAGGTLASLQLYQAMREVILTSLELESFRRLPVRMLARSVGELWTGDYVIIDRHPSFWVNLHCELDNEADEKRYRESNIERKLTEETEYGSPEIVELLHTVQIRRSHGWVSNDD